MEMSPEEAVEYVRTKKGALDSACWFWDTNNLNKYADACDVKGATKRINGGYIGLEDREKHYKHAMEILGGDWEPAAIVYETVRVGSRGPTVMAVQEELEIGADGVFGRGTEAHVKAWQEENGLTPDGIMGPASLKLMFEG
jgi:putative chitinase